MARRADTVCRARSRSIRSDCSDRRRRCGRGVRPAVYSIVQQHSREGEVQGIPGLRYSWNRDETILHLTYGVGGEATRTFAFNVDGDFIRDEDGNVVGRIIGGNRITIDTVAVLPDLVKQDEPRLCPAYAPDVAGSDQGKDYEDNRARQYEDFVKQLINPGGPTPSGYVYYLPNPADNGKPVSFDDCEQKTSILFEIKGEGIAK